MSVPHHVRAPAPALSVVLVAPVLLVASSVLLVAVFGSVPAAAEPTGAAPAPPAAGTATTAVSTPTGVPAAGILPAGAIPAPHCSASRGVGIPVFAPPALPAGPASGAGPDEPAADGTGLGDAAAGETRTAVVDRFEGDRAVLLVEARGEVVARRLVRRTALPRAARHDDAVVTVTVVADSVAAITYRPAETARRERRARRRFERLSEPAPGRDWPVPC